MKNYRDDYQWFKNNKELTFLDSAAGSLKPQIVVDSINHFYHYQATNPHNEDSNFTHHARVVMNEARKYSAQLINCKENEIIFTSGATESLMLIAESIKHLLKKGDEIILSKIEHSSNLLPWYKLRDEIGIKIKFFELKGFDIDVDKVKDILSPRTKVVSFTGANNLTGLVVDVERICKIIRNYNKEIIIATDIAQRIPHVQCDVKKWDVDFAAYSGNKMFGPTGTGVCYIKEKYQDKINPLRYGGGMNSTISEKDFCYINGVEKFEGGTPNTAGIYGLLEATKYLLEIGYCKIKAIESEFYDYFKQQFNHYQIKDLIWINQDVHSATFIFNIKNVFCQDLANYLGSKGIIVRSGLSCAKLMDELVNDVGVVRASCYVYSTKADIDKLFNALKEFRKEDILNGIV